MIVVVASRFDESARAAVAAWRAAEVALLTPDDLLTAGWSVLTHQVSDGTLVAQGQLLSARNLTGVVNLLTQLYDFELLSIRRRDRRYVGAELFAFLVWWLGALPCPVLNRPTPGCLNGPSWRSEQWVRACRRADIPARPVRRDSIAPVPFPSRSFGEMSVTSVVCGRAYGEVFPVECRILSALAGTDFLEVFFQKENGCWLFLGVNLLPSITLPEVRGMLDEAFICGKAGSDDGAGVGIA